MKRKRHLSVKTKHYIEQGICCYSMLDNHIVSKIDDRTLNYRSINIKPEVREKRVRLRGTYCSIYTAVVFHSEQTICCWVNQALWIKQLIFKKKETFFFWLNSYQNTPAHWKDKTRRSKAKSNHCESIGWILKSNTLKIGVAYQDEQRFIASSFTRNRGITPIVIWKHADHEARSY